MTIADLDPHKLSPASRAELLRQLKAAAAELDPDTSVWFAVVAFDTLRLADAGNEGAAVRLVRTQLRYLGHIMPAR